jgi:hypothetical protein
MARWQRLDGAVMLSEIILAENPANDIEKNPAR